jgi:hypothetical protein
LLTILGSSLAFLLGLVLLVFELRPAPKEDIIRLRGDGLGSVTVHIDSVRKLILHSVALIPAVLQMQPRIRWSPQGLNIYCRTALTPDANIPQVSSALQAQIKQAVEQYLGMKVANVAVQAQLDPLSGVDTRPRQVRRQLR